MTYWITGWSPYRLSLVGNRQSGWAYWIGQPTSGWAGHIILHNPLTHMDTHWQTHTSCLVSPWCPWELSCCLGATAFACHTSTCSQAAMQWVSAEELDVFRWLGRWSCFLFFFFTFHTAAQKWSLLLALGLSVALCSPAVTFQLICCAGSHKQTNIIISL